MRKKFTKGFTLVEAMIAMTIMALVIVGAVGTVTSGFRLMENARFSTLASQVLQSEMENLRLKNWVQLEALPTKGSFSVEAEIDKASFKRFSCVRTISTVETEIKQVVLTVSWKSSSGTVHKRQYVTYIARYGLNDYFYRKV